MTGRVKDWRPRLSAYLSDARVREFAYGRHDCASFAIGAIRAITGGFPAEIRYTTETGGLRVLARLGFREPLSFARAHWPEIAPILAREGDLAVIETEEGAAFAICIGTTLAAPASPRGLCFRPLTDAAEAFRVG